MILDLVPLPFYVGQTFLVLMHIENRTERSDEKIKSITGEIARHGALANVLAWAAKQPEGDVLKQVVSDVIVLDEYTHEAIVPWKDGLVLVYGIT